MDFIRTASPRYTLLVNGRHLVCVLLVDVSAVSQQQTCDTHFTVRRRHVQGSGQVELKDHDVMKTSDMEKLVRVLGWQNYG